MEAVGLGLGVIGSMMQSDGEARGLEASAAADRENARLTQLQGEFEALEVRRQARAAMGDALAATAAMGGAVGTGSALDLMEQSALDRERDVLATRYNATTEGNQLRAQSLRKRKAAHSTRQGGALLAGAQLISGVTSLRSRRKEAA